MHDFSGFDPKIADEREQACDELVLTAGPCRAQYADALVRMAELSCRRGQPPVTALATTGSSTTAFKRRVLKVLEIDAAPTLRPSRIAAVTASMVVVLTLAMLLSWSRALATGGAGEDQDLAEGSSEEKEQANRVANDQPMTQPTLQMVESEGTHYNGGDVVQAHIGYTPRRRDAWMNWLEKGAIASLEKLPAGKHWLIAKHPWTVFPVELPLASSPLKQQSRVGLPPQKHSSNQYSAKLTAEIDEAGKEFIRVDVENMTDEPLSFCELDLKLGAGWGGDESEAHSPLWLTEKLDEAPRIEIEARQTGSFQIDWTDWVRRGTWDPMSGVQQKTGTPLPERQPGKIWVRIGGPGFGSLPIAVTHPDEFPEDFSVTLPNGNILELLGMTTPPINVKLQDERTWWQANGTPFAEPVRNPNNLGLGEDRADGRQALFRLTCRQSDASLHVTSPETRGWSNSATSQSSSSADEPSQLNQIFAFGPIGDATTTTLQVQVATAPWTSWKFDLTGKPFDAPEVSEELTRLRNAAEILRAGPSDDGVAIWTRPFSSISETGESRITVVDKAGKVHFSNRSSGDGQENVRGFPLSPEQFDHFEFQARLFGPKVKFENVSLQPGNKTEPKISVESIDVAKTAG